MAGSSSIKLDPFKYGEQMARSGIAFYLPYDNHTNNALFRNGYESYLRRTSGVPKGKEQPLP